MKKLFIIAVLVAGCGAPFVAMEPEQDQRVVFLVYGAWEAPPPEDVCVDPDEDLARAEIRLALASVWRQARLTVYRAAALSTIAQRHPYGVTDSGRPMHRLSTEQRTEIAADAEAMALAMLDAERGGAP